jgi:hypothetical protein
MASRSGGKWIQGAIKKPGSLRKSLGVKKGQTIPASKLQAAAKKGGVTGRRARLALTLKGMNKGGSSSGSSGSRKRGTTHRVSGHTRTLSSGKKVRVKGHTRKNPRR